MAGYRDIIAGLASRRWRIKLATHFDTEIDNETSDPTLPVSSLRRKKEDEFAARWRQIRVPTAGYNCFGHIFALRRTAIYDCDRKDIDVILVEDGFGAVDSDNEAAVGDIVLYSDTRGYDHAARIVGRRPLLGSSDKKVLIVLSKFDDVSGEYEHQIDDLWWGDGRIVDRRIYRARGVLTKPHPTWRQALSILEPGGQVKV